MSSRKNLAISVAILSAIYEGLLRAIPEIALTVSTWAATRRVISQERVADPALAGLWKNDRTPYLVEIMDAVNQPDINEIIFVKSAQVGGTEAINNIIGYFIDVDPATILYLCETEPKARAWSVECFAPMLRDTPTLAAVMDVAKSRDSNNQIESKLFPGGHFALAWSTSAATLSSRPRRVVLKDESDAFKPTPEGDPGLLAEARTKTAGSQRKIIDVSTPRNAEGPDFKFSPIEKKYHNSTREKYFVPCPHCDEFQFLKWSNVTWDDGEPELAYYVCEACGVQIENSEKFDMLARGEWRSTNPEYQGNRRGFWINEIYSPFTTWGEMATAFLEVKDNPEELKVFTNTRLAESWKPDGEKIDYADLRFNKEDFGKFEIPDGVIFLTAAVDVQGDRLECEVVGWGTDYENWSIDYRVFQGDPTEKEVWKDLKEHLLREWTDEDENVFRVKLACIDSGGHHAQEVYKFCKENVRYRWYAVKGASTPGNPIISPPTRNNLLRVKLFRIGTEAAKDMFFGWLKRFLPREDETQEIDTAGFCHFPDDRTDSYFKQLCAEKKITKHYRGRDISYWMKVSDKARNEALDLRVYNIAAMHILYPTKKSYPKKRRIKINPVREPVEVETPEPEQNESEMPVRRSRNYILPGRRKRSFGGLK